MVRTLFLSLFTAVLLTAGMSRPALCGLFGEFSIKDEAKLGRQMALVMGSRFDFVHDPFITGYIQDMADRLTSEIPPQPFPFKIQVVNNNSMNAFATAAGYVYVFSGLILNVESESELAGVIAHEFAHVTERHIAQSIERSQLIGLGTLAGMLAGAFIGTQGDDKTGSALMLGSMAGGQTAALQYSREHEREADQFGMNYLTAAGYRPQGLPESFKKIRRLAWLGGSNVPSYLSTHPGVDERIGYLEQRVARMPDALTSRRDDNEQLRLVQTLLRAKYTDPQNALAHFQQSKESCPGTLGKAVSLARLNRMDEAEKAFTACRKCPDLDPALLAREYGKFHYEYGDLGIAAQNLLKAVILEPDDGIALYYYARMLAEQGNEDDALIHLQRILVQNPLHRNAHRELGLLYGRKGDIFQAYIHLCHADMLDGRDDLLKKRLQRLESMKLSEEQKKELEDFQNLLQERRDILSGKK